MNGIKTSELDTIKAQVLGDEALRNDFTRTVQLFQDFIKMKQKSLPELNVSVTGLNPGNTPKKPHETGKPTVEVKDRYYTRQEYGKLSASKRKQLHQLREARGGGPPRKKKTRMELPQDMLRKMAAMCTQAADHSETSPETAPEATKSVTFEEAAASSGGNRTHAALTRQPRK